MEPAHNLHVITHGCPINKKCGHKFSSAVLKVTLFTGDSKVFDFQDLQWISDTQLNEDLNASG